MQNWIEFSNRGGFDIALATIIGFTTKRDDETKVGKFGSGLKYSIPFLLRNRIDFALFVGEQEYKFTTETIEGYHNDKVVTTDLVICNGERTGLSIDAGPDWNNWFVVREIVQNAYDEEEFKYTLTDDFRPEPGYVKWYLPFEQFKKVILEWDDHFSFNRKPLFEVKCGNDVVKAFAIDPETTKGKVYYQGFYVGEIRTSKFDYELNNIDINEYREMSNVYTVMSTISFCILTSINAEDVPHLFYDIDFASDPIWYQIGFINNLSEHLSEYVRNNMEIMKPPTDVVTEVFDSENIYLSYDAFRAFHRFGLLKGKTVVRDHLMSPTDRDTHAYSDMNHMLDQAYDFFKKINWPIEHNIEIVDLADGEDKTVLGIADTESQTIYLSSELASNPDYGYDMLLKTLIEEKMHILTKSRDYTRKFQDAAFALALKFMKEQYKLLESFN